MLFSKKIWNLALVFFLILFSFSTSNIFANEKVATIVNPIRSRQLWKDKSLKPLSDQYQTIDHLNLSATWLIQNDVFSDQDLINQIKNFNSNQEFGLFLEVSPDLAKTSRVYYPSQTEWYSPKAVFLSAYQIPDRQKIIDQMVLNFKNNFGYLPKSAGAWWIDSWSQQYLENKYHLTNFLIVADQKTTDSYGVWGQWWGYPYHPSENNILTPGNSPSVVIQWAQRDLSKAYYGQGPAISNFSLQANDYLSQKLNFNYFTNLANQYLSVEPLGQITVGLETGMESVGYEKEYEKQLTWISNQKITSLTMSQFGDRYRQVYQSINPEKIILGDWLLTPSLRQNLSLNEKIDYNPKITFTDKFIADQNSFLSRDLNNLTTKKEMFYLPLFLLLIPILIFLTKSFTPVFFTLILYLPIFRSFYSSGWKIFYGPALDNLLFWQILILIIVTLLIFKINKKLKLHLTSWFSVFSLNLLLFTARYSLIDGQRFFGFLLDNFRFIGISFSTKLHFLNQDLSGLIASSMLKFDPNWIWQNWYSWLIIYPAIEILLVVLFNKILPKKIRYILCSLSILFIIYLFHQPPLIVK